MHKLKSEKNKAEAEVALLKAQLSFPNVEQLNELLLHGDLKEIPPKLEDFTKTITSLTLKVDELKTLQWELLAEFLAVPSQVEMVQAKLKTLDALLEEINHQKKLKEDAKAEAAKPEEEVRKAKLVDLLGLEVEKKYYNDKLQYDRYYDKMLNRREISRINNCDVLTRKGLITLKVYREDGTSEIIPNFKKSDMHLGE
nr:hypothetical protein [Tanacetum cinerariifolium]